MLPAIRPIIAGLPTYVEGKTVPGALKLASNETVYEPLPSVADAISDAVASLNRYPDNSYAQLRAHLASFLQLPESYIAAGCGSASLCQQLIQICCDRGDEVVFGWRSFEIYPLQAQIAGAVPVKVPLRQEIFDLDRIYEAITKRTRLVFICNPNNPTSTIIDPQELSCFLDRIPDNVLVVLDEAYVEYIQPNRAPQSQKLVLSHPNVAVLRTFSKAYGLAGIRLGYCFASPGIIQQLRKVYVPFSVSTLAQVAGVACLQASQELSTRIDEVIAERKRMSVLLNDWGYRVPDSQANFLWLPLQEKTRDFTQQAYQAGIIVRPFENDGVRVTISSPQENDVFLSFSHQWKTW